MYFWLFSHYYDYYCADCCWLVDLLSLLVEVRYYMDAQWSAIIGKTDQYPNLPVMDKFQWGFHGKLL